MQEDTVLDLAPLGVDGQTAFRHLIEFSRMCAVVVNVPAFEDITGGLRDIIVSPVFIVAGNIRRKSDVIDRVQCTLACLTADRIAVAVHIYTIQEVDRIVVACIVEVDRIVIGRIQ